MNTVQGAPSVKIYDPILPSNIQPSVRTMRILRKLLFFVPYGDRVMNFPYGNRLMYFRIFETSSPFQAIVQGEFPTT